MDKFTEFCAPSRNVITGDIGVVLSDGKKNVWMPVRDAIRIIDRCKPVARNGMARSWWSHVTRARLAQANHCRVDH